MSKLALIRQYQYSPQAGSLLSLIGGAAKLVGGIFKKKAPTVVAAVTKAAKNPIVQGAAMGAGTMAATSLLAGSGGGGRGASGSFGGPRRSRGITARELRGYRKVANLLHKEGMVSKRARGRH